MGKIVHEKPDSQSRKKRFVMKHKAIAKVIAIAVVATSCGSLNNNNNNSNSNGVDAFSFGITTPHNNAIRRPTAPMAIATRHDSRKRNLYRLNNHHQHHYQRSDDDDDDEDLDDGFDDCFDEETNTTMERKQHPKNNPFANMLVAAAFVTATLDPIGAMATDNSHDVAAHKGLDLVSPGTTLIETKTDPKLVQNTETTLNKLAKTTFLANNKRKAELTDSVKRIKSTITTELTTVEAWKEVTKILQDYGVDLKKDTSVVVRPPADWRTTYDDFVLNKRVNVLLNGEIIQIQLEYQKGSNSKETMENVQPDDEWVLRIRGYKGYDPNAPILPMDNSRQPQQPRQTPEWYQKWDRYWNSPTTFGLGIAKSNGDAIVLGGSTTVALSYAVSYAYYVDMNEKEDQKALEKQTQIKAKKEAAAAKIKAEKNDDTKEDDKTKKPTTPKPTRKAKKEKAVADKAAAVKAKEEEAVAAKSKKEELAAAKVAAARAKKEEAAAAKAKKEEIAAADSVAAEAKKKKAAAAKVVAAKAKMEEAAAAKDLAAKAKMEKRNDEDKKSSKEPKPSKIAANESANTTTTTTTTTAIKPVFVGKTVAAVPSDDSTVAPVEAAPADDQADETDDDVRVTIDFDEDGKVVIRTSMDEESSLRRKDGALAFVQALYFPWLGFFVSSSPASDADDDRPKIVRFAQALYFPWVGVFFPKEFTTTSTTSTSTTMNNNDTALDETAKNVDSDDSDKNNQDGNNGVLPLIRALWFPWIGIFQGK